MTMTLPQAYLARMKELLGEGYDAFLKSYGEPPAKGLRFNLKKARPETIERLKEAWNLKPVPWCPSGYYYEEGGDRGVRPGKSPYHDAGVFYIQEPSAMLPAEEAGIRAGEKVLDLCAAPGGKSTQAACRAGLLVSNEYIRKRAQILSSNIERMGLSNVIVTNTSPAALSEVFPGYFDCILVDAPCSGEGMMRRDETAVSEWSEENIALCISRQREILDAACKMLAPGGRLVYSTCTFEPGENERQAEAFCSRFPEMKLCRDTHIFPHLQRGEGHYCALFEKDGGAPAAERTVETADSAREPSPAETETLLSGAAERLRRARIPVLRCGVEKGEWVTGKHKGEKRYEPSHAEALAMRAEALSEQSLNLHTEALALSYLHGESLNLGALPETAFTLTLKPGAENPYLPVCYDGYPLGFGKYVKGTVKNHYPKGLRRL